MTGLLGGRTPVSSISVRYLRVFGSRCQQLFRDAGGVGTALVHIPRISDDDDHLVSSSHRDEIPAALDALGAHGRRMEAVVAVLDEWQHLLTPRGNSLRPCGHHSGPIRDRIPPD